MKLVPPGLLTNGNYSNEALILEARWLLAFHFNWNGRCIEASRCFDNEGEHTIPSLLEMWDLYNQAQANRQRSEYYFSSKLDSSDWGPDPTETQG